MKVSRVVCIALLASSLASPLFAAGEKTAGSGGEGKPIVVVSILPQSYFVERIAGDAVKVVVLVGPGQDPHSYEPTPRQMADLAKASAWLSIGVDFEKALKPKIAALYPRLAIVDTTVGVRYRRLESHHHEGEAEHEVPEESGDDPHIWLGHQAVKAMALNIRDALGTIDPAGSKGFEKNHGAFVADVDRSYAELAKSLESLRGTTAFVYHPAFGYLLDDFGIEQEAVETGGKEPTQKALAALIEEARADGAKVVFVQAQFPSSAAKTVAKAIGGVVVSIDPLAADWLSNIERIGAELKKAAR